MEEPFQSENGEKERVPQPVVAGGLALLAACLLGGCIDPVAKARRTLQDQGVPATADSVVKAIETNDAELLDLLTIVDAPFDGTNEKDLSPLMIAVKREDRALLDRVLPRLDSEAIERATPDGLTALSFAVESQQHQVVDKLLEAGATPDVAVSDEAPAIAFAVKQADAKLVSSLLTKAAHSISKEKLREPLCAAVRSKSHEISDLLLEEGVDPNVLSAVDQKSPLCLAIEFNETELAKKLVAKGAEMLKVKSAGAEGNDEAKIVEPHLMTVAFDHENMELIHLLLELEAPLDGKDEHGRTPLKRALAKGNTELVKLLLDHGAKPDDTLFMALDSPNREVIDLLLANGASLEAKNEAGDTPLLVALEKNDLAVAKQLLDSEPYLHVTGRYGQNVVCVATAKQNVPFLRLLLEHGADPNTEFEPGLTEQLKEIIPTKNFQFYLRKDAGLTPIMLAAHYGNVEMTQMLIEHGARRFKISRKYKRWPVNFACEGEHIKCAQLLLGRDPDSKRNVHVEISLKKQRAVLYRDGEAVLSTNVSTGMRGYRTAKGEFVISNKARHHTSSIYGSPMPYFQRLSCRDFGFHVGVCPGYPASHGCIRMPSSKARAFFKMTQVGDPVTIKD